MQKIAISVMSVLDFTPNGAIRGSVTMAGADLTIQIESMPPGMTLPGSGDWLEQDSFGNWQRRPNANGSDAKFTLTTSGAYLVAAHRGNSPAILTPVQVWQE